MCLQAVGGVKGLRGCTVAAGGGNGSARRALRRAESACIPCPHIRLFLGSGGPRGGGENIEPYAHTGGISRFACLPFHGRRARRYAQSVLSFSGSAPRSRAKAIDIRSIKTYRAPCRCRQSQDLCGQRRSARLCGRFAARRGRQEKRRKTLSNHKKHLLSRRKKGGASLPFLANEARGEFTFVSQCTLCRPLTLWGDSGTF